MSDFQAIAGVSETLKALLEDRMNLTAPNLAPRDKVTITISHPSVDPSPAPSGPRLNLFLFDVVQSPYLRNQEIGGPGSAPGYPPLALELHYLMTAYPTVPTDDSTMQMVLGDAMRVLHDTPTLSAGLTRLRGVTAGTPILNDYLRDAFEQVKVTFSPTSLDVTTKLWQALQKPYRLSVAFSISVIQIDSRRGAEQAPLVRDRQITGVTGSAPTITAVAPAAAGIGQMIKLSGSNLGGPDMALLVGSVPAQIMKTSPGELVARIPDQADLQPGELPVQAASGGFRSGALPFRLVPRVTGVSFKNGLLEVTGYRLYRPDALSQVLVGGAVCVPDPATATQSKVTVAVTGLMAGKYPVRVRVGETESLEPAEVTI